MKAAIALLLLLVGSISRESFPLKSIVHLSMKGVMEKTRMLRVSFNLEKAWRDCGTRLISSAHYHQPRHLNHAIGMMVLSAIRPSPHA